MSTAQRRVRWAERTGRPTRLTPRLFDAIIKDIRDGSFSEVAAAKNGVGSKIFYGWMKKGREGKRSIYTEFWNAIEIARAEAEHRAQLALQVGAPEWRSRLAWLERARRGNWGRYATETSGDQLPDGDLSCL